MFWTAADLENKLLDFRTYFNNHRTHTSWEGRTPDTPGSRPVANLGSFRWQSHCRALYQTPATSFLAFPGAGSYRRICRALFGSASEKNRPSASRLISQTYTLCSTIKRRALAPNWLRINSQSGCHLLVISTLRTDWGRANERFGRIDALRKRQTLGCNPARNARSLISLTGSNGDEFPTAKFLRRFRGLAMDEDKSAVDEFLHARA